MIESIPKHVESEILRLKQPDQNRIHSLIYRISHTYKNRDQSYLTQLHYNIQPIYFFLHPITGIYFDDEINFPISFRYFDFNYIDSLALPIYKLGRKPETTVLAMLTIVSNANFETNFQIPSNNWDIVYVLDNNYSSICSGGNHRSLAHRLLGYEIAKPYKVCVYKDINYLEQVNEALLKVSDYLSFDQLGLGVKSSKDLDIIVKLSSLLDYEIKRVAIYMKAKSSVQNHWRASKEVLLSNSDVPILIYLITFSRKVDSKPLYLKWFYEYLFLRNLSNEEKEIHHAFKKV